MQKGWGSSTQVERVEKGRKDISIRYLNNKEVKQNVEGCRGENIKSQANKVQ